MLWDKESGLNNLVMPRTGGDRLGGVVFLHEDVCPRNTRTRIVAGQNQTRDWEY